MKSMIVTLLMVLMIGSMVSAQDEIKPKSDIYPFALEFNPARTLIRVFPTPNGYERFPMQKMTRYMAWLTNMPLKPADHPMIRYDSQILLRADSIGGVLDIGVTSNNQKGEDFPIQLALEYLKAAKQLSNFYYKLTETDSLDFDMWLNGKLVKDARGNYIYKKDTTREYTLNEFYRYLEFLMRNSTAKTLLYNLDKTDGKEIVPGDIYVAFDKYDPDSAAFVAVVLDVCTNADGDTKMLIAEGGYPAQSYYIPRPMPFDSRRWFTRDEFQKTVPQYSEGAFYRYSRLLNL